jgi:hypothetical protein
MADLTFKQAHKALLDRLQNAYARVYAVHAD